MQLFFSYSDGVELFKTQGEERQEYLKSFKIVPSMFTNIPPRGKGYFDIIFQPSNKIEFEEKVIITRYTWNSTNTYII